MRNYIGYDLTKYTRVAIILLSISLLSSCSSKNENNVPENKGLETPPAKFMEFGMFERTVKDNVVLVDENVGNLKESEVLKKIQTYAQEIDTEALNATIDSSTWNVKQGRVGKKVNVEKTMETLISAKEGSRVDLVVEEQMPQVTSEILNNNIVVIGSYTTTILDRHSSRVNNIKLASQKIDGFKIAPGEEFSFNKVVGRRTIEKGYEKATIITRKNGKPKKGTGVGGGICQVSSTLYNAVEKSGLKIIERHKHSKAVNYVPKGQDATVTYGAYDFKFSNNRSYPIMIRTNLSNTSLTIKILENRNS